MLAYGLFFIWPVTLIGLMDCFFTRATVDRGFNMPNIIKIMFCIPPWVDDITISLLLHNAVQEGVMIFAILKKDAIYNNLNYNAIVMAKLGWVDFFIILVLILVYGITEKRKPKNIKDTISLTKIQGSISVEDREYSCNYEYVTNRYKKAHKVMIIIPDALYTTRINGNIKPSPRGTDRQERYNIGAYDGLAENIAIEGIGVIKLERLSPFILENCDSEKVKEVVIGILKEIGFDGEIVFFFHGDNHKYIEEIASVFPKCKIVSACNYMAYKDNNYIEALKKVIMDHEVITLEANYDPRIRRRNKQKLSRIQHSNYKYRFYKDMELTLRERDRNTLRGGVTFCGREIGSFELKDVYKPMTDDLIEFIG